MQARGDGGWHAVYQGGETSFAAWSASPGRYRIAPRLWIPDEERDKAPDPGGM